jgi:hypothetical protein
VTLMHTPPFPLVSNTVDPAAYVSTSRCCTSL